MSIELPGVLQPLRRPERPKVPEFVPDGSLSLFPAFSSLGRSIFCDAWTGDELIARSAEQINAHHLQSMRRKSSKAKHRPKGLFAVSATKEARLPDVPSAAPATDTARSSDQSTKRETLMELAKLLMPPFRDEKDECAAYERGQHVWSGMRQALFAGRLPAQALTSAGHLFPVSQNVWGTESAFSILRNGRAKFLHSHSSGMLEVDGWVVIKEADLTKFMSGTLEEDSGGTDQPENAETPPASNPMEPAPPSMPTYSTPFLKLLSEAIREFEITDTNQPKVETLRDWFQQQEVDGEKISQNLAGRMATIVRLPKMREGGARPQDKSRRR